MTKLSDTQSAILNAAIASEDETTTAPLEANRAVAGLIKRGLLISIPQADGPSRLMITATGREAVAPSPVGVEKTPPPTGPAPPDLPKGKIGALVALLRQEGGTTVEAMMAATGWQAHSVRGALSGAIKKGLGLNVVSEKTAAGRLYRIASQGAA